MNKIICKQDGLTFLGFLIVLGVIGAFALMALRLFPLYNEKFKVLAVMQSVANQPNSGSMTQAEVWKVFYNNADVQGVRMFGENKVVMEHVKLEKEDGAPVLHVFFEKRNKLFDDIELVLNFDKTLPLGSRAGGGDE